MDKTHLRFFLLLCCASFSTAANILALFTTASPSHHIWNSPLVVALASRGHNVTVLSPEAQKNPIPNLTDIVIEGLYEAIASDYNYEVMFDLSEFDWITEAFNYFREGCKLTLKSEAFKQLMNYPSDTTFDLVIIEGFGTECLFGILPKFGNPPTVALNGFGIPSWIFYMTGTPNIPSQIPHSALNLTDHMTFTERVKNFVTLLFTYYHHHNYLKTMDKETAAYFGPHIQPAYKTLLNNSFVLANFHPAFDYPWATTPSLIPIAGIQIIDPQPLSKELQEFLDGAKEGAIYFSLGTNVRSDKLTAEKRKAILDAFAEIPQKVLWKYESELPGLPKNVKIKKWLPQRDILGHPNVKAFITHSGMLSSHEAVHRGIPVIGIPFLADQHINIRKLTIRGCGILLNYKDLTKESLLNSIHKIINDSSYKENMKRLSTRFRDDPQTPLERAVFWTEYVLRHKGAPHLQSAAKDLNFIQYFCIDVIAILLAVPSFLFIILYYSCCRRKSKSASKLKKN